MPKTILNFLKISISVCIAGLLLYFVFRNENLEDFQKQASLVDYTWVTISIVLSLIAYAARAYRWNILLEPLGYKLTTLRTMIAVLVGYLANLALPRLGEITRCGVLNRNDKVAVPAALGSVVTERIIDVLTLLILILISLILESDRLFTFLNEAYKDLNPPSYIIWVVMLVGLAGISTLILLIKRRDKMNGKFASLIKNFIDGLLTLKDIKNPIGFFVSTAILWIIYFLMSYTIVFSLPATSHLGIGAGLMLLITGGIAISLPVQSGFGTYHGMIAGMLVLYSIDETTGKFLATLLHTSQIVAVAIFGSIALVISFLIRRNNIKKDKLSEK
ncbi:lysylphosphatidylglycerol synthase transmembrane domain-containing protein [Ekhidna sp.]